MDFFKSLSNSFDPSQNGLSNAIDPNKNGLSNALTNSFDPNKNGVVTKLSTDSNIGNIIQLVNNNNTFKNLNTNNLNGLVSQITNDLSPQNINNTITTNINPQQITKTIINDPTLNKIIAPVKPIIKPVIEKTVNPIIDNLPTTIKPKDIVNSSITIGNQAGVAIIDKASEIGDTILSVFSPIPIISSDNTITYIIIGSLLIGMYLFIPNKKKIIKSNN